MRYWIIGLALFMSTLAGHAASAACLREYAENQVVTGRLTRVSIPGGHYYILNLRRTACLEGGGGPPKKSRRIQLHSTDDDIRDMMDDLSGKAVRVRGMPRPPSRPYHRAPITMRVDEIDRL